MAALDLSCEKNEVDEATEYLVNAQLSIAGFNLTRLTPHLDNAERHLKKVIVLIKTCSIAYYLLAIVQINKQTKDELNLAIRNLRLAIIHKPSDDKAKVLLEKCLSLRRKSQTTSTLMMIDRKLYSIEEE